MNKNSDMKCKRGHEILGANIYTAPSGLKVCRACRKKNKTYQQFKKANVDSLEMARRVLRER